VCDGGPCENQILSLISVHQEPVNVVSLDVYTVSIGGELYDPHIFSIAIVSAIHFGSNTAIIR
jgi:hypothetical protein